MPCGTFCQLPTANRLRHGSENAHCNVCLVGTTVLQDIQLSKITRGTSLPRTPARRSRGPFHPAPRGAPLARLPAAASTARPRPNLPARLRPITTSEGWWEFQLNRLTSSVAEPARSSSANSPEPPVWRPDVSGGEVRCRKESVSRSLDQRSSRCCDPAPNSFAGPRCPPRGLRLGLPTKLNPVQTDATQGFVSLVVLDS